MILAVVSLANDYQVVRKPTELLFLVGGALDKAPSESWQHGPLFRKYSTRTYARTARCAGADREGQSGRERRSSAGDAARRGRRHASSCSASIRLGLRAAPIHRLVDPRRQIDRLRPGTGARDARVRTRGDPGDRFARALIDESLRLHPFARSALRPNRSRPGSTIGSG